MALSETRRRLVTRLHRRKTREREGLVLIEGARAVAEALAQGARPRFALQVPDTPASGFGDLQARLAGVPDVEAVTREEMRGLSGTETPQGLILVVEEPTADPGEVWESADARIVLLDGVQDPGNVGTLVRVSAAFGCTALITLDGTADPWSPKAVRASAGTAFRIPLVREPWSDTSHRLDSWPGLLFRADAAGRAAGGVSAPIPWALALGGEGEGCRPEVIERANGTLSIPMPGGVESLNVGIAGALLLYELTRDGSRRRNEPQETA